jgi:flagellin
LVSLSTSVLSSRLQRYLDESTARSSKALERLSSGMRINRASDDAAGLAVAASLNADARVYSQGIRNLNDGISLLNTAESSLHQGTNIIQRLRELANQAANGVYSSTQRAALDSEAFTLTTEFNRVLGGTEFNGLSLLQGGFGRLNIQSGYGSDGVTGFNLGAGLERSAGTVSFSTSFTFSGAPNLLVDVNKDNKLDAVYISGSSLWIQKGNGDGTFQAAISSMPPIAAGCNNLVSGDFNGDGNVDVACVAPDTYPKNFLNVFYGDGTGSFYTGGVSYSNFDMYGFAVADLNKDGKDDLIGTKAAGGLWYAESQGGSFKAPVQIASGGQKARIGDFNNDGNLDILQYSDSSHVSVVTGKGNGLFNAAVTSAFTGVAGYQIGDFNRDGNLDIAGVTVTNCMYLALGRGDGTFAAETSMPFTFATSFDYKVGDFNNDGLLDFASSQQVAFGKGDGTFNAPVTISSTNASVLSGDLNGDGVLDLVYSTKAYLAAAQRTSQLKYFSLATSSLALSAFSTLDEAQQRLDSELSSLGSYQSRFATAVNHLGSIVINSKAAESRIRDADVAEESASLVRQNVLQQTAAALMAQANSEAWVSLNLLRGINTNR